MKIEYRGVQIEYKGKTIVKVYGVYRTTDGTHMNHKSLASIKKAIDERYESVVKELENYYRKNGVVDTFNEGYKCFKGVLVKKVDAFNYRFMDPRNGTEFLKTVRNVDHLKQWIAKTNYRIENGWSID